MTCEMWHEEAIDSLARFDGCRRASVLYGCGGVFAPGLSGLQLDGPAPYNICSVVCATSGALFVAQERVSSRLFRVGLYLFMAMNWVSAVGYGMFPLADGGKDIASFQEVMHIAVTAAVVLLSIASLIGLIVAGCRDRRVRGIAVWAAVAFAMMLVGSIGTGVMPPEYFGIVERFSVFVAVGFNAVLGCYLFNGFKGMGGAELG